MAKRSPLGITPEQAAASKGPKRDRGYGPPQRGTSIPREGGRGKSGGDPATKANRAYAGVDRTGPRFNTTVRRPGPQSPESSSTMANGRIVGGPPTHGAQQPDFYDQAGEKW